MLVSPQAGDVDILTDIIPATMSMSSIVNISQTTVAHSGQYICHAQESVANQLSSLSINITVLGKHQLRILYTISSCSILLTTGYCDKENTVLTLTPNSNPNTYGNPRF